MQLIDRIHAISTTVRRQWPFLPWDDLVQTVAMAVLLAEKHAEKPSTVIARELSRLAKDLGWHRMRTPDGQKWVTELVYILNHRPRGRPRGSKNKQKASNAT